MTPYKKAVDADGNIIALVHHDVDRAIILYPVAKTETEGFDVDVRQCVNIEEAKEKFLGGKELHDVSVEEYNDTLFVTWGFSGSNIYKATEEGAQNVGHLQQDNGTAVENTVEPAISANEVVRHDETSDAGSADGGLSQQPNEPSEPDDRNDLPTVSDGEEGSQPPVDSTGTDGSGTENIDAEPQLDTGSSVADGAAVADEPASDSDGNSGENQPDDETPAV